MELQDDEAVRHWVETILAIHHWFPEDEHHDIRTGVYYAVEAFYTAYYSKAVILQRRGQITAAILNFKVALMWDGGCHATYYQLENLKRQETDEDSERYRDGRWPDWEMWN